MAEAAVRSGDIFDRDVSLIDPDPDNTRDIDSPVARADIETIALSIVARGYDADQEILVRRKRDGRWMVTDGHKRRLAYLRALELGAVLRGIPCRSEKQGTNDEDRAIIRLRAPGRRLSPLEAVVDIKRLLGWNWTKEDIAAKLGESIAWVNSCLDLAAAAPDVRQSVRDDKIAPTEALKVVRRHGPEAGTVIRKAVEHARGEGRERARPRDVAAVEKPRSEPISVCSLATAAVKAWRNSEEHLDGQRAFRVAMEALEAHLGPLARQAA